MELREFLNQPFCPVEEDKILEHFKGKTILVTGGAGSVGSMLCKKLFEYDVKKVIALDIDDTRLHELWLQMNEDQSFVSYLGNLRDYDQLTQLFINYNIDIVFHAGALKHVPLLELYPEEAIKTNILGTYNIVDLASKFYVEQFINISTDKAANPINIMGATKYVAEHICADKNLSKNIKKSMSVRFGNIYGSRGSVVPIFLNQIKQNREITITDPDMERFFILPEDAIRYTLQACTMNNSSNDKYIFNMGKQIKIEELAIYLVLHEDPDPQQMDVIYNYTQARPGEKLSEVLIGHGEYHMDTQFPKILSVHNVTDLDLDVIYKNQECFAVLYNFIINLINGHHG